MLSITFLYHSAAQFSNDWFHFKLSSGDFDFFDALDIPFDKVVKLDDINGLSLIIKNMAYESYSSNQIFGVLHAAAYHVVHHAYPESLLVQMLTYNQKYGL